MAALEALFSIVTTFVEYAFSRNSRVWPVYIVVMIAISYGIYLRGDRTTSFRKWAFPRSMYFHASHRTDLKLFVLGQFIAFVGLFKMIAITTFVATTMMELLGGPLQGAPKLGAVPMTVLLILTLDFTVYWVHRLHHETRALWPFHSVHHSAEVMTPITLYRKHPIYDVLSRTSKGLLGGALQGIALAIFVDDMQISTIASVNAGYFLFNIVGSNLRHTHIWLSYGPALEHVFISPAQHQIHHSIDTRHFNKNYGEVFAIWDWMFGTLYVPKGREKLRYGLCDGSGTPVPQPHTNVRTALWLPIKESWRATRRSAGPEASPAPPERVLTEVAE